MYGEEYEASQIGYQGAWTNVNAKNGGRRRRTGFAAVRWMFHVEHHGP